MKSLIFAAIAWLFTACAIPLREAKLPSDAVGYVAVLSGEMPAALSQVARHAWIVANVPGGRPQHWRFELQHSGSDPFEYFGTGDVAIHAVLHFPPAELDRVVHCLDRAATRYLEEHPDYFPIPGPNSNTIVDAMLRACDLHVELPATAIGRNYRGLVGASVTSAGTGVQLETVLLGAKLGLEEGAEIHLLDLSLGVHLWPPAITVPVNPGRIGFEDAGHRPAHYPAYRDPRRQSRYYREHPKPRKYGLGNFFLYSRYARLIDPEEARDLRDLATVGLEARGSYGKRLGYSAGFDLEGGVGVPLGFAYAARLYPLGLTLNLGGNSFVGSFLGVGADGVGGHVPGAFELPAELRFELDVGEAARFGATARASLLSGAPSRREHALFSFLADDLLLSTFVRVGTSEQCSCPTTLGRGYFFALERGAWLGSPFLGLKFGIEADFGG